MHLRLLPEVMDMPLEPLSIDVALASETVEAEIVDEAAMVYAHCSTRERVWDRSERHFLYASSAPCCIPKISEYGLCRIFVVNPRPGR